ncbi:MAG TPA: penicillin-binding transpeptidase domain-containing protein [Blastocatellia bacterium]|nr:penicillin-binding transpeptidase domain-containing protein [Blastocatellia bacterium]
MSFGSVISRSASPVSPDSGRRYFHSAETQRRWTNSHLYKRASHRMLIPFILTIIFVTIGISLMLLLAWAAWRHRNPAPAANEAPDVERRFGPSETNQWIRWLRVLFVCLLVSVLGFHSYWVFWADSNKDSTFNRAKRLDARNLRLAESGLKGWVLDRSGKLENALIRYRSDAGVITREYPLGAAAVHVTGYSDFIYGAGGIESAYRDWLTKPASTLNRMQSPTPVGEDLRVSVDVALQREAFSLIQATGKPAAALVLLLPNNEVLAMASAPSFDPRAITLEDAWLKMSEQAEDFRTQPLSPLVNRALGTLVTGGSSLYYRPGSTFKVFVAAVAIDTGVTAERFTCRGEGFTPPGSNRPIRDFGGEVHGTIGLADAFRVSCNQYFAQLGLKLGKERLASYAARLRFAASPAQTAARSLDLWQTLHGDKDHLDYVFAPPIARMNLSSKVTSYDVALQSFGQGYDDFSVMSMALLAATAASPDGAFVGPTFEVGSTRKVIGPFISAPSAAQLRVLMRSVVERGTAASAFASMGGRITAGGKTGTADRDVFDYDRQGKPVVDYIDKDGDAHYKTESWTDSWFIGFAPAEDPKIAFAVLVENGGQGAKAAAPIAARLVAKAASLGYIKSGAPPR